MNIINMNMNTDLITDVEGLSSGLKVQEDIEVGEVVAERAITTGFADVIRVKSGVVVRSSEHEVAVVIGGHAEGGVGLDRMFYILMKFRTIRRYNNMS